MIVGAIDWTQSIRAFWILSTFVADYVVFHLLVVQDLEGWMDVLELGRWQMRDDVFVVDDSECVGDNQVNIGSQISISNSRTSINVNLRNL